MFVEEIRCAIEASPRCKLPDVAALMWRAYGAGQVTEAEAEALSTLIEVRRHGGSGKLADLQVSGGGPDAGKPGIRTLRAAQVCASEKASPADVGTAHISARGRAGSRPRTDASMGRRRRWAASGRLPPALAARFTTGELAVLAVLAAECAKHGRCVLAHGHLAAVAGVSVSTVKRALRAARDLALIEVEVRRVSAWRNDTNRVTVVSREWLSWLRLARSGGGVQVGPGTPTQRSRKAAKRPAEAAEEASGGRKAGPLAFESGGSRFADDLAREDRSRALGS